MTIRKQLINLDSAKLADTLLELAGHSEEAAEMAARLVASGDEKVARFRARLADLKKSGDFMTGGKLALLPES